MNLPELVQPVLVCFEDPDPRVRYYACESLYNIAKIARGAVLVFFNLIFDGLCKVYHVPYIYYIVAFGAFLHGSIFNITAVCLREKQRMLVNNECSSRYSRVGNFFKHQFGIGEDSFCTWPDRTTPLQSAWSMVLSAITVECEHIYLYMGWWELKSCVIRL